MVNIIQICDACFQEFPKQPIDHAQDYVLNKQDSCLNQASALVNTGPDLQGAKSVTIYLFHDSHRVWKT